MLTILALTVVFSVSAATSLQPDPTTASVSGHVARIDELVASVADLELSITNQPARRACVGESLAKMKGLQNAAGAIVHALSVPVDADAEDDISRELGDLQIVSDRVAKLAADAHRCSDNAVGLMPTSRPKRTRVGAPRPAVTEPGERRTSQAAPPPVVLLPPSTVRDETSCLKQAKLAALIASITGAEEGSTAALARQGVEPLGGWDPDGCTTLDVLCTVVARTLQLEVDAPQDAYSYVEAVRRDGLPLDLLPQRRRNSLSPVLIENEVRAFLAYSYAAQLPSSRRIQPD